MVWGLRAGQDTPPEIISKINADMVAMLGDPAIKEKFKVLGVLAQGSTPAELAARNKADAALLGADHQGGQYQGRVNRDRDVSAGRSIGIMPLGLV